MATPAIPIVWEIYLRTIISPPFIYVILYIKILFANYELHCDSEVMTKGGYDIITFGLTS